MSGLHLGTNFRKFGHGKLPPLALIVIILLPLLFGGLFVWSYYDPLGNFNKVPVALVNSDEGDAGQEVVDTLLEEDPMEFHVVSAEEAREGVGSGKYYLAMEIPTDFTEAATSVNSDHPRQAKINIALNETNGFIPTMLGNVATQSVANAVSNTVGAKVVDQLFVGFNTIGEGMDAAAEGAGKLDDGAGAARDGSEQLGEGAGKLDGGLQEFNSQLQKMPDAANQLDEGVGRLQSGAQELGNGINTAASGSQQLADGMTKLKGGTDRLGAGAAQIAGGVDKITGVAGQLGQAQAAVQNIDANLANVIADLDASPIPGTEILAQQARDARAQLNGSALSALAGNDLVGQMIQLQNGAHELANQLQDPASEYRSGVDTATSAAQQLAAGLARLQEGSGALLAGVTELKNGTSQLVVAANTASDASSKLAAGSNQLVVGLGDLNSGLVQLSDGTGELSMKLSDGAAEAPRWEGDRLDQAIEAASEPVVAHHVGDEVTYFGKGLSPFFLSLSLWFGGLIMFMVMPALNRRAIDSAAPRARVAMNTLTPAFIIGFFQSLALWIVQVFMLKVEPAHPIWLLIVLVGVSWAFITAIYSLNAVFGQSIGRLITMALMSLQLVASNGLYPPEVQPKLIQWVHTVDPMRYSVDLVRFALFGTTADDPRMHFALFVLVSMAAVCFIISCIALRIIREIPRKDVHPEIAV